MVNGSDVGSVRIKRVYCGWLVFSLNRLCLLCEVELQFSTQFIFCVCLLWACRRIERRTCRLVCGNDGDGDDDIICVV